GAGSTLSSSLASGTAIAVGGFFPPAGTTIKLPDSATATISTGGGSIWIGPAMPFPIGSPPGTAPIPASNLTLDFTKSAGSGTGTLHFIGGTVFTQTTNATTSVGADVILNSDLAITMNVNGSTFTNNGAVNYTGSSPGTTITVQSTTSNLTLAGTGSFGNSASSTTAFLAMAAGSTLTISDAAALTVSGGTINITTPQLNLNNGSVISALGLSTINITSPAGSALTIQAPSGGSATIQTGGGNLSYSVGGQPISGGINITAASGQSLFVVDSGVNPATLNLNGGAVVTTTANANTTVGSGVTFASDSLIVMNVNNGTLLNSGLITSSAAGDSPQFNSSTSLIYKFASTVTLESLSGSLTLGGDGSGQISATGSGGFPQFFNACLCIHTLGPNIAVLAYGPDSVNVNSSYTFHTDTGVRGFTLIGKVNTDVSGVVNLG